MPLTLSHSIEKCCKCQNCGTTLDASIFEADHKIAYSKGGATEAWNAQALCRNCNRCKSDKTQ